MKNVLFALAIAAVAVSCTSETSVDEGANITDTLETVVDSTSLETVEAEGVEASAE
jgi:hypothetical protein